MIFPLLWTLGHLVFLAAGRTMRLYLTTEVDFKRQNINIWNVPRETSLASSFLQQQSVLPFTENLPKLTPMLNWRNKANEKMCHLENRFPTVNAVVQWQGLDPECSVVSGDVEAPAEPGSCTTELWRCLQMCYTNLVQWGSSLWSYHPAPAHTVEGFSKIKITSFPHHSKRKAGLAWAEAVCGWCCTIAVTGLSSQRVGMPAAAGCREHLTCCWLGTAQLVSCIEEIVSSL